MVDRRQSASSLSHLQRRFTGLSLIRKSTELSEEVRGPLGLSLLYEPSEPLIDFIFVHGLRGGSRKTWSKTESIAHYWPQEWLPLEPEFKNVRIHSFGYNSDWGERKGSALTIHDFGQALIGDLATSPHLNRHRTPLVLVAHSMGGVVVKKAFLLAKRDPNLHSLASRFQSIFFLATPHRGADSAQLLENMLRISGAMSMKAYVGDLKPGSGAIQSINDEFRHVYQPTQLWSFFETVATSLGMIVEKDSAVLGLPNENVHLLNADHRHVCKFEDPTDDNYRTLRNAFLSTIETIDKTWYSTRREDHRSAMKILSDWLRVGERPETDLSDAADKRTEGSCLWLTDQPSFQAWQEGIANAPKVFWLIGEPGTGKSVLAGHVATFLTDCSGECSYFFFKHGDATRSTVSDLIRSLAWQMAFANTNIRDQLLEMQRGGETLDHGDERSLWRSIFASKIFQVQLRQPCYWIIDALDECSNITALFPLISKVDKQLPLHIFVTSRPSASLEIHFQSEKIPRSTTWTSQSTSLTDIRLFVEAHRQFLPVDDHDIQAREHLIDDITQKSNGSFLWASLVVQELATANSEAQVRDILQSVPTEMDKFYQRILDNLLAAPRNVPLAKAILRWTVCAARPLTTDELKEAIRYDIGEVVPQLDKKAGAICGHLVFVDRNMRVRVTHATVRTYLVGGQDKEPASTSEFHISRVREHSRLAKICLDYLSGPEMKPPKYRPGRIIARQVPRSAFAEYAVANFAEHVARATSADDAHLLALHSFLQTNVFSWIETIAVGQDLHLLTQTAKQLKNYMERRSKYIPPLGVEIQNVQSWTTDLVHLIAEFGKTLLASPSSIYFLIPPLCPTHSMIYQATQLNNRGFWVAGLSRQTWDDRLSCIVIPETKVLSVSSCDSRFCLGLHDKTVRIYNSTTMQEELQIDSSEPVRAVKLASTKPYVVTASRKTLQLYDTAKGTLLWRAALPSQTLSIEFDEDESRLYVATQANTLSLWQTAGGLLLDIFQFRDTDEDEQIDYHYQRPATFGAISPGLGLLAIAYRQRPVTFWDLGDNSFLGQFHKANASYPWPLIVSLLFNPQPDIRLAAVAYHGGDIVVLDPCTLMQQATVTAEASILAASPNGTVLAAAHGSSGAISLYDFETLKMLYRLNTYEEDIKSMTFASNNLRFFDTRGEQCNIWEPSVLVRQGDTGDDSSLGFSEEVTPGPQTATSRSYDDGLIITALASHHDGDALFCGRENGSVAVYSAQTGGLVGEPFDNSRKAAILHLDWCPSKSLLGVSDRSTRFTLYHVCKSAPAQVSTIDEVFSVQLGSSIYQVVFSPDGALVLISTADADILFSVLDQKRVARREAESGRTSWTWTCHPGKRAQLLLLCGANAHIFSWMDLEPATQSGGVNIAPEEFSDLLLESAVGSSQGRNLCVRLLRPRTSRASPQFLLWSSEEIRADVDKLKPAVSYPQLAIKMKYIIGTFRTDMLFLDHDGWVCSLKIETMGKEGSYVRHFFVPYGWHSIKENLAMGVTEKGTVFMSVKDEIAIFHNGLDVKERVPVGDADVKPSASMRSSLRRGHSSPS